MLCDSTRISIAKSETRQVSIETTQIYLHADLSIKEQALARTRPAGARPGRYQPPDTLLAWLEHL